MRKLALVLISLVAANGGWVQTQAAQPENAHHISPAAAELPESHCSSYHG